MYRLTICNYNDLTTSLLPILQENQEQKQYLQYKTVHSTSQYTQPHNTKHYTQPHNTKHYTQPHNTKQYTQPHNTKHYTQPHNTIHYTQPHNTKQPNNHFQQLFQQPSKVIRRPCHVFYGKTNK